MIFKNKKKKARSLTLYPIQRSFTLKNGETVSADVFSKKIEAGEIESGPVRTHAFCIGPGTAYVFSPGIFPKEYSAWLGFFELLKNFLNKPIFSDAEKNLAKKIFEESASLKDYALDLLMPFQVLGLTGKIISKNDFQALDIIFSNQPLLKKFTEQSLKKQGLFFEFLIENGAFYEHFFVNTSQLELEKLEFYLSVLPQKILSSRGLHDSAFLHTLTAGRCFVKKSLNALKALIAYGIPVNQSLDDAGTFLHVTLANEMSDLVIAFISSIEDLKIQYKNAAFDYTLQDGEGKTLLLLAVKTGQTTVVEKLSQIAHKGQSIGIEITDHTGRTPLQYAIALGHTRIAELLLNLGASLKFQDTEGHDGEWYLNQVSNTELEAILRSIHIEPERDSKAPHNFLYCKDAAASPLICDSEDESKGLVLISEQNRDLIEDIIKIMRPSNPKGADYIVQQSSGLSGTSYLEARLEEKKKLPVLIQAWKIAIALEAGKQQLKKSLLKKDSRALNLLFFYSEQARKLNETHTHGLQKAYFNETHGKLCHAAWSRLEKLSLEKKISWEILKR
ncbi:MAG: ankyrin repeat domain-containing protein [Gammaproteobacteria bacterium]